MIKEQTNKPCKIHFLDLKCEVLKYLKEFL